MTIVLTRGATALALPEDLIWADELSWAAVAQKTERSITGALIVDTAPRVGGRPITLQGDGDSAWIDRATLLQLKAWADAPGQPLQLSLRGQLFNVMFDNGDAEETRALAMQSVVEFSDKQPGDYYCSLVLRFLEI